MRRAYRHCWSEQLSPGALQMPQLALQQTWPSLHCPLPHSTAVGVRGAPAHCCRSHVAPGATQMPQLALQQTCPVLQVLRPHIEIVFCAIKASALLTLSSQADGAAPATPSVEPAPAPPLVWADVSDVAAAPALPLAPAIPPGGVTGIGTVGRALGPGLEPPELPGVVALTFDSGPPTVTALPVGAARSGAISPTSPTTSAAFITNPRLWANPTTLTTSSSKPTSRPETTTSSRCLDQRRARFGLGSASTLTRDARPVPTSCRRSRSYRVATAALP